MEYVQMTLNDWVEMKRKLRAELLGVKQSFVRIGYALRKIEEGKLYEQDGYKSVAEFAKAEYGLEHSTVSRFMSINREYSIDGYSEHLRPEYAELGRSQLEEMLKLPESDREMIQPETSRQSIRDLKNFNKQEPAAGVADSIDALIEKFFQENREELNKTFLAMAEGADIKDLVEIVNPGGNRSYKKGMYFLMMYENKISVKQFGQTPQEMTWEEFFQRTRDIFGTAAGENTWKNYFGGEEDDAKEEVQDRTSEQGVPGTGEADEKPQTDSGADAETGALDQSEDREEAVGDHGTVSATGAGEEEHDTEGEESSRGDSESTAAGETAESTGAEEAGKSVAPAQNESSFETSEPETPMGKTIAAVEREAFDAAMNEPEVTEKPFGSRKDWLDTLTSWGMANEMARFMKEMLNENLADMTKIAFWEEWLNEEVDDNGRALEEE